MLSTLNDIETTGIPRSKNTTTTQRLMDYAATYPDAYIMFYASKIVLNIDIDASYLALSNAKIRFTVYYYFKNSNEILNAPIHVELKTLKHVVVSAVDVKQVVYLSIHRIL